MKLTRLKLKNVRQHADTDISFPAGVIGITGENESGKSGLLEGVCWALFGGTAVRGTMKSLRWNRAPARHIAEVELAFEIGGHQYRIHRTENTAHLYEGDKVLGEGTAAVNKHLPGILGMNYNEWLSSFLVQQKDLTRIASMQPTERTSFVRSVLGVGRLDDALKACRTRKNELNQEKSGLEAGLGQRDPIKAAVGRAEKNVAEAGVVHQAQAEKRDAAAVVHETDRKALVRSMAKKDKHDRHTRAEEQAVVAAHGIAMELMRLEERVQQQVEAAAALREAEPELAKMPGLRTERDELMLAKATSGERQSLESRIEDLFLEAKDLNTNIEGFEKQIAAFDLTVHNKANAVSGALDARLDKMRLERTQIRAKHLAAAHSFVAEGRRFTKRFAAIKEAGVEGECPTCARRLGDQFESVVKALQDDGRHAIQDAEVARIEALDLEQAPDDELELEAAVTAAEHEVERLHELREESEVASRQRGQARERLAKVASEIETARTRLSELVAVEFDPGRLAQVEVDLTRIQRLDQSLAADRGLAAQTTETKEQIADRRKALATAEDEKGKAHVALSALGFDDNEHDRLFNLAESGRTALEDARVSLAQAEEAERGAKMHLKTAREALSEYDQRAGKLQEVLADHHTHERTAARLADFRTAVAATIRPEMEELMSGFIHILTDGRHEAVELTEEFEAILHESGVATEVVSGGTEDIAALAMRLAISQMIAERAGHPLSLLILDEPFGSLDETRRANVLVLIRRLGGVFRQIIIISHVAETRDAVDHIIELEFDEVEGRTRILNGERVNA